MYGFLSEQVAEQGPAFEGVGSGKESKEYTADIMENGDKLRLTATHQYASRHYDKDRDDKQNSRRPFTFDRDFTIILEPGFVLDAVDTDDPRQHKSDSLVDGP